METFDTAGHLMETACTGIRILMNWSLNMGRCEMAKSYEWSENFDAVAWHLERMSKPDYDDYYEEDNQ